MNREILFRGKRINNDEWVIGHLFKNWNRTFILWGMTGDVPDMIEVKPKTVGQYTGLTDKNDKKIFEGDVFAFPYKISKGKEKLAYYPVTYDDEVGIYQPFGDSGCAINPKSVEIIGNVYDRKEAYND